MLWRNRIGWCLLYWKPKFNLQLRVQYQCLRIRHLSHGKKPTQDTSNSDEHQQPQGTFGPSTASHVSSRQTRRFFDRGAYVDDTGRLRIVSPQQAKKECRTALILTAASTHLTEADFTRLLPEDESTSESGFEAAIPGRHVETLEKLSYWIVLFRTPYLAASYQFRLKQYHQNTVHNLPVNPLEAALTKGRGITPPPGYIEPSSGQDVWKRLREYTLLQPAQGLNVTALLPKFPDSVVRAIQYHQKWTDLSQVRGWAVRLRIDGHPLTPDQICNFVREDGVARNRPWMVVGHEIDGSTSQDPLAARNARPIIFKEDILPIGGEMSRNFFLEFRTEEESVRFWRTWHRRPFPTRNGGSSTAKDSGILLHVELMR